MITITAPEKATKQHCEWLRPRGLEGCIIQVRPPVAKLRHAKAVVSRQYPRKNPMSGMHSCRYRLVWCFFPREDALEKYIIGGVWMACFVVAVVPDSVAVVVCRSSASGRIGTN